MQTIKRWKHKLWLRYITYKRRALNLKIGQMLPQYGTGQFGDLIRLPGGIIELTAHDSGPRHEPGTMRLTPYQPNHGFLVQFIRPDGTSPWTKILSYDDLYQKFAKKAERNA